MVREGEGERDRGSERERAATIISNQEGHGGTAWRNEGVMEGQEKGGRGEKRGCRGERNCCFSHFLPVSPSAPPSTKDTQMHTNTQCFSLRILSCSVKETEKKLHAGGRGDGRNDERMMEQKEDKAPRRSQVPSNPVFQVSF